MSTLNLQKATFILGKDKGIPFSGLSLGNSLPLGEGGTSEKRPASASQGPKITNVAKGMAAIVRGDVKFITAANILIAEAKVKDDDEPVLITFDGETISSTITLSHVEHSDIICATVIGYLTSIGKIEEMEEVCKSLVTDYEGSESLEDVSLYKLCDSAYYNYIQNHPKLNVGDEPIVESLQRMCDSGSIAQHPVFTDLDFTLLHIEQSADEESGVKTSSIDDVYDDMLKGAFFVPYEWTKEQEQYIPGLDALKKYNPTPEFLEIAETVRNSCLAAIEKMDAGESEILSLMEDVVNTVLCGEPGTGKTILAYALGAALHMPVYTIALSEKTEPDEFTGMTKVKEGELVFEDTDFLRGFEGGGIVILEEFNLLPPNIAQGCLGQALEYPYVIFKDSNKKTTRHPLCAIFSTMNTETNGSMPPNEAFVTRSPSVYVLNATKKAEFINSVGKKFGKRFTKKQAEWAYEIYENTIKFLKLPTVQAEDIATAISQRSCFELLRKMENPRSNAFNNYRNTFYGTVYIYDKTIADNLLDAMSSKIKPYPVA